LIPVWSGRPTFRGSVLRYFGYRELEGAGSCCSRDREVPKHENPKADGGIASGSRNRVTYFSISGFGFSAIPRTRNRALCIGNPEVPKRDIFWSGTAVIHFGSSGVRHFEIPRTRSRALGVEIPKSRNATWIGVGLWSRRTQSHRPEFHISAFQSSGNRRVKKLDIRTPEIAKPKIPFRKGSRSCLVAVWR
jgi:hypothetical protein